MTGAVQSIELSMRMQPSTIEVIQLMNIGEPLISCYNLLFLLVAAANEWMYIALGNHELSLVIGSHVFKCEIEVLIFDCNMRGTHCTGPCHGCGRRFR